VEHDRFKLAIVEFLGPFALVFAGVGAIIQTQGQTQGLNLVAIALAHGLAIGLMVSAVGHISGGSFNPAVTIGLLAARRIDLERAILYIVAELAGGVAGAGVLVLVYPDLGPYGRNNLVANLGVPAVGEGMSILNALVMEIVLTFFLMFVIFGVAIDYRTGRAVSGLVIGLTITMDILAGGVVSGAVMNPARWFGPALIQQSFANWWLWIVGPVIGAVLAALLYNDVLLGRIPPGVAAGRIDPEHPRDEVYEAAAPTAPQRRRSSSSRRRR
jgi:MIP family channel proteins